MNKFNIAEQLGKIDRSSVVLDSDRCLDTKYKYSDCEACFDICPVNAIKQTKPPILNTEDCLNCLACLPICPAGAYRADDAIPSLLRCANRAQVDNIDLVCNHHPNPDEGVDGSELGIRVRGCLAGLGSATFLSLSLFNFKRITIRNDECESCELHSLHTYIQRNVKQAQFFLSNWDECKVEISMANNPKTTSAERPLWDADNPPLSRRDLFHFASSQSRLAIARSLNKDVYSSKHPLGQERRRELAAIDQIMEENPANHDFKLEGMGYSLPSISEKCTACEACARICPTGAIRVERDENHFQLLFSPRACIACDICQRICLVSAVKIDTAPTFQQIFPQFTSIILFETVLIYCENCGSRIPAQLDATLCSICAQRRQNPFGSKLPPSTST